MEVVGETHGESTDNKTGVVEEQSEQLILYRSHIIIDRQKDHNNKLIGNDNESDYIDRQKDQPVHLERDDPKYQSCDGICDTLVTPLLVLCYFCVDHHPFQHPGNR